MRYLVRMMIVVAVAILLATACGSDDGDVTTDPGTTEQPNGPDGDAGENDIGNGGSAANGTTASGTSAMITAIVITRSTAPSPGII